MSSILLGYIKLKQAHEKTDCMNDLKGAAAEHQIGIWLDTNVHDEEVTSDYKDNDRYLIFSITDSFAYENINKLLLSDLCRESELCETKVKTTLQEDIGKIIVILKILMRYANRIDLYYGNYNCSKKEYTDIISTPLSNFGAIFHRIISDDDCGLKHFILTA